jgi:hypothetical protein
MVDLIPEQLRQASLQLVVLVGIGDGSEIHRAVLGASQGSDQAGFGQ